MKELKRQIRGKISFCVTILRESWTRTVGGGGGGGGGYSLQLSWNLVT